MIKEEDDDDDDLLLLLLFLFLFLYLFLIEFTFTRLMRKGKEGIIANNRRRNHNHRVTLLIFVVSLRVVRAEIEQRRVS